MKKLVLVALLFVGKPVFSQERFQQPTDTLDILYAYDWRTIDSWFGEDVVVLIPMEKLPDIYDTDVSDEERAARILEFREKRFGPEVLSFDKQHKFHYTGSDGCPTGATVLDVRTFRYADNHVFVEYVKKQFGTDTPYKKRKYLVEKWTNDEIILILKN